MAARIVLLLVLLLSGFSGVSRAQDLSLQHMLQDQAPEPRIDWSDFPPPRTEDLQPNELRDLRDLRWRNPWAFGREDERAHAAVEVLRMPETRVRRVQLVGILRVGFRFIRSAYRDGIKDDRRHVVDGSVRPWQAFRDYQRGHENLALDFAMGRDWERSPFARYDVRDRSLTLGRSEDYRDWGWLRLTNKLQLRLDVRELQASSPEAGPKEDSILSLAGTQFGIGDPDDLARFDQLRVSTRLAFGSSGLRYFGVKVGADFRLRGWTTSRIPVTMTVKYHLGDGELEVAVRIAILEFH